MRITVEQLVTHDKLDHDDKEVFKNNKGCRYHYDAPDECKDAKSALDWFHSNIPIGCLEDFEIIARCTSHWDNNEDHPVEDWRYEVANDDTRLGYMDWCKNLQSEQSDRIRRSYPGALCPDCQKHIHMNVVHGASCRNCGHAFWDPDEVEEDDDGEGKETDQAG